MSHSIRYLTFEPDNVLEYRWKYFLRMQENILICEEICLQIVHLFTLLLNANRRNHLGKCYLS